MEQGGAVDSSIQVDSRGGPQGMEAGERNGAHPLCPLLSELSRGGNPCRQPTLHLLASAWLVSRPRLTRLPWNGRRAWRVMSWPERGRRTLQQPRSAYGLERELGLGQGSIEVHQGADLGEEPSGLSPS